MLVRFNNVLLLCAFVAACVLVFAPPAHAQVAPPGTAANLPSPLSLDQALIISLRQQPQRYEALAQVTTAKGQKEEAVAQYFPTLTPTYQYENNSSSVFGVNANSTPSSGSSTPAAPVDEVSIVRGGGLSLALDQNIYDGGQREAANAEARHNLAAAELNEETARQTIIETVTQDFYQLLLDEDLITVANANIAEYEQTVALTKAQIAAGTEAANDVYQAQANLANAQVTLIQDQIAAQTASATLKNAMGVVSDSQAQPVPLAAAGALPPLPKENTPPSLDSYAKDAYDFRPDLLAQQAEVETNLSALRLAEQNAGVNVSADYLVTYQATNDLGDRGLDTSLLVSGSYPLFDAGAARGSVRAAHGTLDVSKNQLESVRQQVRLDVEVAYNQRSQYLQSAALAQSAVQAAKVNYDSAVAGRKVGVGTILDIITAQETLTQAQNQYVTAIYDFYISDAELQKAIGRNETPATMSVR